jgi:hypothetical protein
MGSRHRPPAPEERSHAGTAPYTGQSVLLLATDDGLDSLEVSWTTDQPPVEFPAAEDLIIRGR